MQCKCGARFKRKDRKTHSIIHDVEVQQIEAEKKTIQHQIELLQQELAKKDYRKELSLLCNKTEPDIVQQNLRFLPSLQGLTFGLSTPTKSVNMPIFVQPLSFKDAAAVILRECGPLHVNDILKKIKEKGLMHIAGSTPEKTLSTVLNENNRLFKRTDQRAVYDLNHDPQKVISPPPIPVMLPAGRKRKIDAVDLDPIDVDDDDDEEAESTVEQPKKKKKKDPNYPKRPITAFFYFGMKRRPELGEQHKGNQGDISKILSAEWKEMTEDQKRHYKHLENMDKQRYETELRAYNDKNRIT
jgi:hypothetical protein